MIHTKPFSIVVFWLFICGNTISNGYSQTFLNGDFENNSVPIGVDQINLLAQVFNNYMLGCVSFGSQPNIDIITSNTWGNGGAQNLDWYIALTRGTTDMLSLELSSPLISGNCYSVSFYDRADGQFASFPIEVGLSSSPTSFGTLIWTSPVSATIDNWSQKSFTFIAPISGQYVTLRQSGPPSTSNGWIHLDNFVFGVHSNSSLNINLGNDTILCVGETLLLNATIPNAIYTWQDGSTDSTFNVTQAGTYWVEVNDGVSCDPLVDTIEVSYGGLAVELGGDTTLCSGGNSLTLDAGTGAANYLWSDNSTNQTLTVTQSGTYYVQISDGSAGCVGNDTIQVNFGTLPTVNAGIDQNICQGMPVTLTGSGAPTLSWDNGVTDGMAFTPNATNTYVLTGASVEGCTNTDTVVVTVNPLPTPTISGDLDYCEGETTSLTATAGYTSYSWSNGVTTPTNANLTALNNPVTVTVTDGNGCSGTSATATLVEHTNPIVDLGPDAQICAGGAVQLDAQNPGASYLWSTGEITPTITVNTLGSYHVAVTTTAGCMGYDTTNINVGTPPVLDAGPDQTVCRGEEVILAGTGSGVFMWSNNVQDNVPFVPTQTTNYTLTMIDANNCTNTDEVLITVEELPEASFVYVPHELDITTPEVTFTNTTINGNTYQWTFGEGGTSTEEHPVYEYQQIGTYQVMLIAISDYGCVDTAYATLEVKDVPYFYVPNSFSPNGDGVNDLFYPVLSGRMPSQYELLIFNRWGEVIFQTNSPNQGWDGTYQGTPCQIDNYVWVVTMVDGGGVKIKDYRGHVSLVR